MDYHLKSAGDSPHKVTEPQLKINMTTINGIEVLYKPANHDFSKRWQTFGPSKKVLPKGWQKEPGRRSLDEDLIFEKDVPILLRDGVTTYCDVFRPVQSEHKPIPAILAWSPYGKQGNGTSMARTCCQPSLNVS